MSTVLLPLRRPVFKDNLVDCYDEETKALVTQGIKPDLVSGLKASITSAESRDINFDTKPKVIISAAGMCDAGRIRHHLKHNLWRPECTIVFTGYQSIGTLGRSLLEGGREVRLFGETIQVEAHIEKMDGMSAHADMEGLIQWLNAFEEKPLEVFLVHGNDEVCDSFGNLLKRRVWISGGYAVFRICIRLSGRQMAGAESRSSCDEDGGDGEACGWRLCRLLVQEKRLLSVIRHNEGGANKDLAKFCQDQINSLCDKWDR